MQNKPAPALAHVSKIFSSPLRDIDCRMRFSSTKRSASKTVFLRSERLWLKSTKKQTTCGFLRQNFTGSEDLLLKRKKNTAKACWGSACIFFNKTAFQSFGRQKSAPPGSSNRRRSSSRSGTQDSNLKRFFQRFLFPFRGNGRSYMAAAKQVFGKKKKTLNTLNASPLSN